MALEAWTLDGITLTTGQFLMMELTANPPKARAEWLTAADSEGADLLREPLHENREITMKLRVAPQASMDAALDQIGTIRDKFRAAARTDDGISLVWTPHNSTRSRTFSVLHGEFTDLPIGLDGQAAEWFKARPIFTVVMTCKPYWYGTEVLTTTATASTPLTTLEITGVTGDVPALGRLIVTDMATQSRRHVEWGLEARNYQPSTSLLITSLTTSGTAGATATTSGAYHPTGGTPNSIVATIGPLPVIVCKTGNQSHIGTFRVQARVWYNGTTYPEVYAGLNWQVAGGELSSNALTTVRSGGWRDINLGVITIPPATSGTQQWQGMIRAQTPTNGAFGDTFTVNYIALIPVDEGYGKARGQFLGSDGVVSARDNYTGTTALAFLNGRVAPVGGTWATSGSTSSDFRFRDAAAPGSGGPQSEYLEYYNQGVGDTQPRFAILGATNYTDVTVRTAFTSHVQAVGTRFAVIARWTNSTNYVYLEWSNSTQAIKQVVAGTTTTLASRTSWLSDLVWWYGMSITVYASGRVVGELLEVDGSSYGARLEASSSALATGGTLATGRPGISAQNASDPTFASLFFDDFYVITPTNPEAIALYSGRTMEFRHNDTLRQDSTGTYYGRPSSYRGSRLLIPPGTSRVAVKARRNDADVDIDGPVTDSTRIQVGWTPRGLVVPR